MRQIIVITDGYSNEGVSPSAAAAQAYARGIVVNVIGVVDRETEGMRGEREIESMARAGGGIHRVVTPSKLAYTMQMMTRHTVVATIQQVVNQELRAIMNDSQASVAALPPAKRAEVVRAVDEWTEMTPLKVALLIDASASMRNKFDAVRDAAHDLLISLQARKGPSELAVLHYPGNSSKVVEIDVEWTSELAKLEKILYKLNVKGTTPTGPAILQTISCFEGTGLLQTAYPAETESAWGDYVV